MLPGTNYYVWIKTCFPSWKLYYTMVYIKRNWSIQRFLWLYFYLLIIVSKYFMYID